MAVGLTRSTPRGYVPVCLACLRAIPVPLQLRSHALAVLEDHQRHACPTPPPSLELLEAARYA